MAVKNIIFDLGGVLVNINETLSYEAFKKIIKPEIDLASRQEVVARVKNYMETGQWSQKTFIDTLLPYMKPAVEPLQIIDAWCAMLLDFPVERVNMLKELAQHARLFLLSNTDPLHIAEFEAEFVFRYGYPLQNLFSKVFYSSDMGVRKPAAKAFIHVLDETFSQANETIFIDDRADNCQAAEQLGIKCIQVPANTGLEKVYKQVVHLINTPALL